MFGYEVWHDGQCLIDSENVGAEIETEEEAMEEGLEDAKQRLYEWKVYGCWSGETLEDFDIRVKEI